jgi:hypothetical protein
VYAVNFPKQRPEIFPLRNYPEIVRPLERPPQGDGIHAKQGSGIGASVSEIFTKLRQPGVS